MDTNRWFALGVAAAIAAAAVGAIFFLPSAIVGVLASVLLMATIGISLQVVFGILGELSLGQCALFGIAAYAYALATVSGWPVWLAVIAGIVAACVAALLLGIGLSRVRGAYFAVITYAIGVLLGAAVTASPFFGGSDGFLGVGELPSLFPAVPNGDALAYAAIGFLISFAIFFVAWRAVPGLTLEVVRSDRLVARSLGIKTSSTVLFVLFLSAIPAALAGVMFAGTGLYVG